MACCSSYVLHAPSYQGAGTLGCPTAQERQHSWPLIGELLGLGFIVSRHVFKGIGAEQYGCEISPQQVSRVEYDRA